MTSVRTLMRSMYYASSLQSRSLLAPAATLVLLHLLSVAAYHSQIVPLIGINAVIILYELALG